MNLEKGAKMQIQTKAGYEIVLVEEESKIEGITKFAIKIAADKDKKKEAPVIGEIDTTIGEIVTDGDHFTINVAEAIRYVKYDKLRTGLVFRVARLLPTYLSGHGSYHYEIKQLHYSANKVIEAFGVRKS